jgi:hypothetical protein
MTSPFALKASIALLDSNQTPKIQFLAVDHLGIYSYPEAIAQLKDCGYMSLVDMQELSSADLNNVFEEIKCWCIYGNHDPKKLRVALSTPNP